MGINVLQNFHLCSSHPHANSYDICPSNLVASICRRSQQTEFLTIAPPLQCSQQTYRNATSEKDFLRGKWNKLLGTDRTSRERWHYYEAQFTYYHNWTEQFSFSFRWLLVYLRVSMTPLWTKFQDILLQYVTLGLWFLVQGHVTPFKFYFPMHNIFLRYT